MIKPSKIYGAYIWDTHIHAMTKKRVLTLGTRKFFQATDKTGIIIQARVSGYDSPLIEQTLEHSY